MHWHIKNDDLFTAYRIGVLAISPVLKSRYWPGSCSPGRHPPPCPSVSKHIMHLTLKDEKWKSCQATKHTDKKIALCLIEACVAVPLPWCTHLALRRNSRSIPLFPLSPLCTCKSLDRYMVGRLDGNMEGMHIPYILCNRLLHNLCVCILRQIWKIRNLEETFCKTKLDKIVVVYSNWCSDLDCSHNVWRLAPLVPKAARRRRLSSSGCNKEERFSSPPVTLWSPKRAGLFVSLP